MIYGNIWSLMFSSVIIYIDKLLVYSEWFTSQINYCQLISFILLLAVLGNIVWI
jgi:hypothetical protein